jgi:hypothetical protein
MMLSAMTHAEMADRLRALLAADPLPAPRVLFDRPDGRHQIPRPVVGCAPTCPAPIAPAGNTAGRGEVRP